MDKKFSDFDLCKMNDVPCSIEDEVKLILPSGTPGYVITSAQSPEIVSYLSELYCLYYP